MSARPLPAFRPAEINSRVIERIWELVERAFLLQLENIIEEIPSRKIKAHGPRHVLTGYFLKFRLRAMDGTVRTIAEPRVTRQAALRASPPFSNSSALL
jgi:hypothetical protein